MEEILASIRRIIADDDAAKGPAQTPEPVNGPAAAVAPLRPPPAAPTPPPAPARAPAAREERSANEAALDEMLAEIRAPAAQTSPAQELASDVLDLTEEMAGPEMPVAPGFQTIDGQSDVVFEDGEPEHFPEPGAASDAQRMQFHDRGERTLMSAATSAAVDSAFNSLAHTVLVQNARTLEDLVREMLQPLLKTWLDDNLPGLVERLVRAEIERVSRGRG